MVSVEITPHGWKGASEMSDVLAKQERNKYGLHTVFLFRYLCIAIWRKAFQNKSNNNTCEA